MFMHDSFILFGNYQSISSIRFIDSDSRYNNIRRIVQRNIWFTLTNEIQGHTILKLYPCRLKYIFCRFLEFYLHLNLYLFFKWVTVLLKAYLEIKSGSNCFLSLWHFAHIQYKKIEFEFRFAYIYYRILKMAWYANPAFS